MLKEENELLTRVGPGTPMGNLFRRFWLPALLPSQLPGPDCAPVRLRLLGEDLVAFRDSDGRLGVMGEYCPHRRASLYFGRNEEGGIRCVYHGWKFDVDGNCLDVPNAPADSGVKNRIKACAYGAVEWGGFIWVYMGPKELQPPAPAFEFATSPPENKYQARWEIEENYLQGMEGEIDSSHITFLHKFFDKSMLTTSMVETHRLWQLDGSPTITVERTPYGMYYGSRRNNPNGDSYWRVIQWIAPIFALIPTPHGQISCRAYVPVDDHRTIVMATRYHPERPLTDAERAELEDMYAPKLIPDTFLPETNKGNDYLLDREAQRTRSYTGIPGINNQDRAITESMGPIADRTGENLVAADVALVVARRTLMKWARDLEAGTEPTLPGRVDEHAVRPLDTSAPAESLEDFVAGHGHLLKLPASAAERA